MSVKVCNVGMLLTVHRDLVLGSIAGQMRSVWFINRSWLSGSTISYEIFETNSSFLVG